MWVFYLVRNVDASISLVRNMWWRCGNLGTGVFGNGSLVRGGSGRVMVLLLDGDGKDGFITFGLIRALNTDC